MRCLRQLLFLSLLVCGAGFGIPSASAANRYWVGPQGGEWTNAAHWSAAANACGVNGGASVPGSADIALFVSNCVNDVSINPATVISGINIAAGYTGTGTLAGPLTITTFTQAGGSFVLNDHSLTINGAVTISGGTFSAGTATVVLGGAAATINVLETLSLYHLTINANPSATKTIAASDVLIVNGTLTLQDGLLSQATVSASGTLLAHGDIVQESTFDGGTAQLSIVGAGNQLFTGNATRITGLLPRIRIDKPSGLLTLAGTIRVTSATTTAWVYVQGDIDASAQESTVIFAANGSMTIAGSHALHHVIFDTNSTTTRTHTLAAGTTLTVLGALMIENSDAGLLRINTGTLAAHGDIIVADTADPVSTTMIQVIGTEDQVFFGKATQTSGGLPIIEINKPSGTLTLSGTLRTLKDWTYTAGMLDPGTSTVVFAGALTIAGSQDFYNITFDQNSATARTFTITDTITVLGAFTFDNSAASGVITLNTGTIEAKGDIYNRDAISHTGTATLRISGEGNQLLVGNAVDANLSGGFPDVVIDKPSGTLTLSGTIRTINDWTYTQGTIDATSNRSTVAFATAASITIAGSHTLYNVSFDSVGLSRPFVLSEGTILTVEGTLTLRDGYLHTGTVNAKGLVTHDAGFDGGTSLIIISGNESRTIHLADGGYLPAMALEAPNVTMTHTGTGTLEVNGEFAQSAGTFVMHDGTLRVENYVYSGGTFEPGAGTLFLFGNESQTFTPPPTLNNVIFNEGLVGYWKLDSGTGSVAVDSSEYGNDGTLMGNQSSTGWTASTAFTNFTNPYALEFDGVNDYVSLPKSRSLYLSHALSFSAWSYIGDCQSHCFVGHSDNQNVFAIYYDAPLQQYRTAINSANPIPTGTSAMHQWHHTVATYDGNEVHFYVDGVLIASQFISGGLNYGLGWTSIQFGAYENLDGNWFKGLIDDVRIYSRALSISEITALAAGVERPASGIAYTLGGPLAVEGTLTLNGVTLDKNGKSLMYGTLASNGGVIIDSYVPPDNPSVPAVHPIPPGGGRGSLSPGRGGDAPAIDPATRRVLPQQADTVSPLYRAPQSLPPPSAGVVSPVRERLAARIEKRIAEYPRLKTMLLKVLERMDRRLRLKAGR